MRLAIPYMVVVCLRHTRAITRIFSPESFTPPPSSRFFQKEAAAREAAAREASEREAAERKEAERKEAERKEAERKEAERKEAERREEATLAALAAINSQHNSRASSVMDPLSRGSSPGPVWLQTARRSSETISHSSAKDMKVTLMPRSRSQEADLSLDAGIQESEGVSRNPRSVRNSNSSSQGGVTRSSRGSLAETQGEVADVEPLDVSGQESSPLSKRMSGDFWSEKTIQNKNHRISISGGWIPDPNDEEFTGRPRSPNISSRRISGVSDHASPHDLGDVEMLINELEQKLTHLTAVAKSARTEAEVEAASAALEQAYNEFTEAQNLLALQSQLADLQREMVNEEKAGAAAALENAVQTKAATMVVADDDESIEAKLQELERLQGALASELALQEQAGDFAKQQQENKSSAPKKSPATGAYRIRKLSMSMEPETSADLEDPPTERKTTFRAPRDNVVVRMNEHGLGKDEGSVRNGRGSTGKLRKSMSLSDLGGKGPSTVPPGKVQESLEKTSTLWSSTSHAAR